MYKCTYQLISSNNTVVDIAMLMCLGLRASEMLRKPEVLRSLRHYLWAQSQGHHTTDRLEESGVEREST